MQAEVANVVAMTARNGEAFKEFFYTRYDSSERNLLFQLYHADSVLVFNGNMLTGPEQINQFYQTLPRSQHNVLTLDCQPVLSGPVNAQGIVATMMVVATGLVKFGSDIAKPFVETFILNQEPAGRPGQYYIASDVLRMVAQ